MGGGWGLLKDKAVQATVVSLAKNDFKKTITVLSPERASKHFIKENCVFQILHFHYTLLQIPWQKFHKMHLYKKLNELMQMYAQNFPSTVDLFWI